MPSDYLIAVIEKTTGHTVSWAPGLEVEAQFEDDLVTRVKAKGVGLARTEAHVLADVRAALAELLHDLKSRV